MADDDAQENLDEPVPEAPEKVPEDEQGGNPILDPLIEQVLARVRATASGEITADVVEQTQYAYESALWAAYEEQELQRRSATAPDRHSHAIGLRSVIAGNLASWRVRSGLSLSDLSERTERAGLRLNRATIHEIETAKRAVSIEELVMFAALYSVPVVALLHLHDHCRVRIWKDRKVPAAFFREIVTGVYTPEQSPAEMHVPNWAASSILARVLPASDDRDWRPGARLMATWWDQWVAEHARYQKMCSQLTDMGEALETLVRLKSRQAPPSTDDHINESLQVFNHLLESIKASVERLYQLGIPPGEAPRWPMKDGKAQPPHEAITAKYFVAWRTLMDETVKTERLARKKMEDQDDG